MSYVNADDVLWAIQYYPKVRQAINIVCYAKHGARGDMYDFRLDDNTQIHVRYLVDSDDYDWYKIDVDDVVTVMRGGWGFRI